MAGDSQAKLSKEGMEAFLAQVRQASLRQECGSCECLQGFIAQLELDAADDARPLLEAYKVDPSHVHRGLGCERCAPAEVFAEYLMRKRKP